MVFEAKFFVEVFHLEESRREFPQPGTKWPSNARFEDFFMASSFKSTSTVLWGKNFPRRFSDINFYSFSRHPSELLVPSSSCKHFIASTYDIFIQRHFLHVSCFNSLERNRLVIANMKTTGGWKIFASEESLQVMVDQIFTVQSISNCNEKRIKLNQNSSLCFEDGGYLKATMWDIT